LNEFNLLASATHRIHPKSIAIVFELFQMFRSPTSLRSRGSDPKQLLFLRLDPLFHHQRDRLEAEAKKKL
jgi:hypothetical protein